MKHIMNKMESKDRLHYIITYWDDKTNLIYLTRVRIVNGDSQEELWRK